MTETKNANQSTQPSKVSRGFPDLPCMYCGETNCVRIDLDDLTGEEALHCLSCESDYSVADVQSKIKAWLPVLKWIELAPQIVG